MKNLGKAFQITLQALFMISVCLVSTSCSQESSSTQNQPIKVEAIKINTQQIPVYLDYIGTTKSIADVTIRARVKGFLIKQNFKEGAYVKKGQLLFVIDPRTYEAQVNQAKAQLILAISEMEFQKVEYLRIKELYKKQVASKSHLDRVTTQFNEAVARVGVGRAKLKKAELNLSYCYMYSPVSGRIGEKLVDVGNLVGGPEATALANVVRLDPMYVQFSPSVDDFGEIIKYRENAPYKVQAYLPGDKSLEFSGEVDLVNNEANIQTSTILMRAILNNPENLLLPNVYVNVRMFLGTNPEAILVPQQAVMETQGLQFVYTVGSNNKVETTNVESKKIYKGQNVITKGLKVGDIVIVNGLQKIKPGIVVSPQIVDMNNKSSKGS